MDSRERVIRTVEFRDPDRLPIFYGILPAALLRHGQALRDLLDEFPNDFGFDAGSVSSDLGPAYSEGTHKDEWGTVWRVEQAGMIGIVQDVPLPDWDQMDSLVFPPLPGWSSENTQAGSQVAPRDWYAFGWGFALFERLQQLRGYENLLMDIASDDPRLHNLMDRLVDWYLNGLEGSLGMGVDGVHFADDWGTQTALMISPASWRRIFKPRYARMFKPVKDAGKHVWFHTDGYTRAIFEDLVEIGCDVINPQHTIMDVEEIGRSLAGRVAFRTDFDRQHIIPHGTRQEVCDHVKHTIECLCNRHGGAVLHGEIGPDVPLPNVRWMLEASLEFGEL